MRRPLPMVALLYAIGIVAAYYWPLPVWWLFGLTFPLAMGALGFARARPYFLLPLLVLAGWINLSCRTEMLSPYDLRRIWGEGIEYTTIEGRLVQSPEERIFKRDDQEQKRSLAALHIAALNRENHWEPAAGRVMITTPAVLGDEFFGGQTVRVSGILRPPKGPVAPGLFDYRAFLRHQGIFYQLEASGTNDWQLLRNAAGGRSLADRFQHWARATLARGLPKEDEPLRLIWAMALGWKTGLTPEVSEPFMRSGTMHLFAISGLHIALIAHILVNLLRLAQIPRAWCGLIVIPLLWFYTVATGWQSSAIRSTIMMSVIIAGWALKRPGDLLNSLAAAALIILLWQPEQLFQASFQLSFFVVLSMALLLPPIEPVCQRLLEPDPLLAPELRPAWQRRFAEATQWTLKSLATSLAAWIGSAPLIAYYFHLVTPVSLPANLVIVPISAFALTNHLGSLVCGEWLPWLTVLFNYSGWFGMTLMIRISQWSANLPLAYSYLPAPSVFWVAGYYLVLILVLARWWRSARWRWWGTIAVGALLSLWLMQLFLDRSTARLTVLPLGGGDCIFVDHSSAANRLLIDCGSEMEGDFLVTPFLRAQGVDDLPRLLLTHGDARHVGGARLLLTEFSIQQVVASNARFRSPIYRELLSGFEQESQRLARVRAGDKCAGWLVLHPEEERRFALADDAAIVLQKKIHGCRVLLLSDLGRSGQTALLEKEADLRSDIVVCGIPSRHEPLEDGLLDLIQPRVLIISSAEFPVAGRASAKLRQRLERRGAPVFYTDDGAAVVVTLSRSKWEVINMKGKNWTYSPAD